MLPTKEEIATEIALDYLDDDVQTDLRILWKNVVYCDIDEMNPQRMEAFRRMDGRVAWRSWGRDDIVKRAHSQLLRISEAARSGNAGPSSRPNAVAVLKMAGKRIARTAFSVAVGGGGTYAALSQILPGPWAIAGSVLAALIAPGVDKGIREKKKASGEVGWSDLLREVWDVIRVALHLFKRDRKRGGTR